MHPEQQENRTPQGSAPEESAFKNSASKDSVPIAAGQLRIFLGYAAGVGKTHAMLESGQRRSAEGEDVVVGYVETHNRPQVDQLVQGLHVMPRLTVSTSTEQNSTEQREQTLDLDAVLARQPQLVLIDDLASANPHGSRHPKRYQDVEELLRAGIDVYTTLNVAHLESLNDVVTQITGVQVPETVPDRILEMADIRLLDLPVEELQQRLEAGYVPAIPGKVDSQNVDAQNVEFTDSDSFPEFYRTGSLNALRELALRSAARCVDGHMRAYMQSHEIAGPWPAGERLLVCVGTSPLSERLVRTGRRLASKLDAEWTALHVETSATGEPTSPEGGRVARALRLAEDLGGQAVTLSGDSIAETIATYVQNQNITKIVLGKPLRAHWLEWLHPSPLEAIIRNSPGVDVYVISGKSEGELLELPPRQGRWLPLKSFLWSALSVAVATGIGLLIRGYIEPTNLVMLYLLAVLVAAVRAGKRSAILASLFSVLAFDFIFVPPYYTFAVADAEYVLTFLGLLIMGITISTMTARAREQAKAALFREAQTNALYKLGRDLTSAADLESVSEVVLNRLQQTFGVPPLLGLPDGNDSVQTIERNGKPLVLSPEETEVVYWSYQQGQPAGMGTETLNQAELYVAPLASGSRIHGVLGLRCGSESEPLTPEQCRLFDSFASQTALAIDRVRLSEDARETQVLRETERFQTALIHAISHDLRTPLSAITDSLNRLSEESNYVDGFAASELVDRAVSGAERLHTLVDNMHHITQLESGSLEVVQAAASIESIVEAALAHVDHRLDGQEVAIDIADGLPHISVDVGLAMQALINLLDNAIKFSAHDQPIEIRARLLEGEVAIDVLDRGPGIPSEDLHRIFEKFYRIPRDRKTDGSGLGLPISRGIAQSHGGRLWVVNRAGGGALFRMTLPIAAQESYIPEPVRMIA